MQLIKLFKYYQIMLLKRVMEMFKSFLYALLVGFALAVTIHAQDQTGFISIDCGIPAASSYTDEITGIKYISDVTFIATGINMNILPEFAASTIQQQFHNVRSFPDGKKNCYTLNPTQGKGYKYLIRAGFMYGNYDSQGKPPEFDLYLGVNIWDSIKMEDASTIVTSEIIHLPSSDQIYVCLLNKGLGTPFISTLELRLLENSTYVTQYQSLLLYRRLDLGSTTNQSIRYKDDIYDRIWQPKNFEDCKPLTTSLPIDAQQNNRYRPPSIVMSTAITPINATQPIGIYMLPKDPTAKYYVYMHFAEVEKLQANQSREFNISQNGELILGNVVPTYLYTLTAYLTVPVSGETIEYILYRTENSTLPPILNAFEVYIVKDFLQSQTDQEDVDAITNIKSTYGVKKIWQGDPCAPKAYSWDGLNCSFEGYDPPRIISLNLSSSGLTGEITPYISNLTMLQSLDLSNNNLTGPVPDFLSQLPNLRNLNLQGNKLTGSVPVELMERSKNGSLSLSLEGNPNLCSLGSCQTNTKKKKNKFVVPLVVSLVTLFVLLAALAVSLSLKRRKQVVGKRNVESENKIVSMELKNRQFTYSEVVRITNNFERVLGKGGFGIVYHGYLDDSDTQVAVKMLSSTSVQGSKEFHAEVKLLMRVHHRNLTTLVGYCNEDTNMGLIYEYMANGNLQKHLSDSNAHILNWEERLGIAMDAAQGLEYLHNGCKPPIIHRDVKTANILLNENFQAKLADFGLSRTFPIGGTHVSTVVAGTPGYLDPEYNESNWLNEKSDVYSFGVVLLEIITSRPVIAKFQDEITHISQWVSIMLEKGDIESIVEPLLRGDFNISSAWKIVELALACASPTTNKRPTMHEVVIELKECLAMEVARKQEGHGTQSKDPRRMITINMDTELTPHAR